MLTKLSLKVGKMSKNLKKNWELENSKKIGKCWKMLTKPNLKVGKIWKLENIFLICMS